MICFYCHLTVTPDEPHVSWSSTWKAHQKCYDEAHDSTEEVPE